MPFNHVSTELRIYSGQNSLDRLDRELGRLDCSRAVIFCGRTLSQSPLAQLVRDGMGERYAGTFAGVKAHSPVPAVAEGAAFLREHDADAVIAVGGGSAVVSARASSIFLAEGEDLTKIATYRDENGRMNSPRLSAPKLPQIIVPTTPNTAVVKAGTAVFDPADSRRHALFDPKTRAGSVFIHPELAASSPSELIRSASLDTLSLAIDGLISRTGDPIADALLIHAIRLLVAGLPRLAEEDTPELREELTMAALMCGRGTDHTGAGVTTVLGHAIGANHHVENGTVKAALLPHVIKFNAGHNDKGYANLALALGVDSTDAIAPALREFNAKLGLPSTLSALEIPESAFADIAERSMLDWFLTGNPRKVEDPADLVGLLQLAH